MKTLKYFMMSYLLTLIVSYSISAQGPGKSFNPTPADSSFEVMVFTNEVNWDNPAGTILNDVWIGIHPEYLIKIYSGYAITSIEIPSPLEYRKTYFWKVDASDQTGTSEGDLWLYTTTNLISPVLHFFIDSFSTGTTNWIITNEGGDCVWDTININNSNYDLPVTASGIVLSADGSKCGLGTSTISTATLVNPINLDFSTEAFMLFDNDLFITDSLDGAFIEYSDDDGKSWITIWQRPGISYRKSQELIDLTNLYFGVPFLLRFRTIQNGSDSWWAIDNLFIWGSDILSPIPPPSNLIAIGYTNQNLDSVWVELSWDPGGGVATGQRVKRRFGAEYSQYMYFNIADVDITTNFFIDISVDDETIYTYKIGIFENPIIEGWVYSNEATVTTPQIPVELISFVASLIGTDVHLNWSTATELNNSGFEILRFAQNDHNVWQKIGFVPGHGTTTEEQHYAFVDESVSSGKYQYRLKQIDYDGTFEYSDIVEVEVGLPTEFTLEQNHPNPFNPRTNIRFRIAEFGFVSLKVYDVLGNEITTLVNEGKPMGIFEVEFDGSTLTSGVYFYQLKAGTFIQTKKMLMLK